MFLIDSKLKINGFNPPESTVVEKAKRLSIARLINGVAFDGSQNITIADSTKQPLLVSGTNIKTINNINLLGSGNISISSESLYVVNVKDYGAVGDGVTNDTEAIELAIAALSDYDILYFPKGEYLVTPPILVNKSNVILKANKDATIKTEETELYNIIMQNQGDNITYDGLIFDQTNDVAQLPTSGSSPPKGCHILHFASFQNATVRNCKFYGYGVTCVLIELPMTKVTGFG